ncbi:NACHT domain-containing protein [Chamaesiphon minutus]|uniref:Putative NTPase (NACHT family) n=1 Tax=Chamaesiphon minutus (strain ATCC 27169 / PCC 6605) TaxID=1173020 RepID=K9UG18_CHAP6|nr:NACHT domain-containing NTPase [Chamaesiphon minutus]AFY93613.1 putative NTPase (NACHT family) [Chamaesiphon minutus PCC 6605]
MARSLKASVEGLKKAELAFNTKGKTQEYLAGSVDCTRQVVINFFARRTVATRFFQAICTELGLDWREIAELDADIQAPIQDVDLDALVLEVREKIHASIQKRCGTMRVLDMEQPITIDSIYTSVNILEKISRNQRRSIEELLDGCEIENFDRFILGTVRQERIPALKAVERHDKLMILGKPGAGKTTFLKWLALQCNGGKFNQNRVPLFVTLKEFAETEGQPDLLSFIGKQLTEWGIENADVVGAKILQAGRLIVLLDGLDEVKAQDHDRVLNTIRQTAEKFDASQFVITCRIAAKEYIFEQFTEVEVADFDDEQIADFAHKWFQLKDPVKAKEFPQELKANPGLKELATNPLLLTLLCLVFESGGRFPVNRAELYKEGLDVLLKKWDAKRNIRREEVYKQLSLQRKEDLLSQVAYNAFERSDYFFKQGFVEEQIREYIRNLPNASNDSETLQLDSEAVLNSIAAQHGLLVERARGIYSFSHLTFQEYFTARWFKEKADGDFGALISHLTDKQWREVFLLTVGMLQSADKLVLGMKREIDRLLAQDEKLQEFLCWVEEKSRSTKSRYKLLAVRAYYLILASPRAFILIMTALGVVDRFLNNTFALARALDFNHDLGHFDLDPECIVGPDVAFNQEHDHDHALDYAVTVSIAFALDCDRNYARALSGAQDIERKHDYACALARALAYALARAIESTELQESLQQLKDRLPDTSSENHENFERWWQANGRDWAEELRAIMIQHRNIGHDWQFSEAQKELLQQYYDANKLLVDCLNSDCYVSREVRAEIEASLLLPIKSRS